MEEATQLLISRGVVRGVNGRVVLNLLIIPNVPA